MRLIVQLVWGIPAYPLTVGNKAITIFLCSGYVWTFMIHPKLPAQTHYLERYELDHLPNIELNINQPFTNHFTTHLLTNYSIPTHFSTMYQQIFTTLDPFISLQNIPKPTKIPSPPSADFWTPIGLAPSEIWDSHRPSGATDSISYWKKWVFQIGFRS